MKKSEIANLEVQAFNLGYRFGQLTNKEQEQIEKIVLETINTQKNIRTNLFGKRILREGEIKLSAFKKGIEKGREDKQFILQQFEEQKRLEGFEKKLEKWNQLSKEQSKDQELER
jgi:hypothetical protein